jgi:hypothetical protein
MPPPHARARAALCTTAPCFGFGSQVCGLFLRWQRNKQKTNFPDRCSTAAQAKAAEMRESFAASLRRQRMQAIWKAEAADGTGNGGGGSRRGEGITEDFAPEKRYLPCSQIPPLNALERSSPRPARESLHRPSGQPPCCACARAACTCPYACIQMVPSPTCRHTGHSQVTLPSNQCRWARSMHPPRRALSPPTIRAV